MERFPLREGCQPVRTGQLPPWLLGKQTVHEDERSCRRGDLQMRLPERVSVRSSS